MLQDVAVLDEDGIDIPDEWYVAVHPRRGGMAAWQYPISDEHVRAIETGLADSRSRTAIEAILNNPASDRELVERYRAGDGSVASESVRLAIVAHSCPPKYRVALMETYVRRLGLARASAAAVASAAVSVDAVYRPDVGGPALTVRAARPMAAGHGLGSMLAHLRRRLVIADDETRATTVELLETLRVGPLFHRVLTSYLIPERRDWVTADLDERSTEPLWARAQLFFSLYDSDQFRRWGADELGDFVTAWDALGDDAVPHLLRWFDSCYIDRKPRQAALDVLSRIPTDAAMAGLLERIELSDVPTAVKAAADRFPRRAARLMSEHPDEDLVPVLLARHRARYPETGGNEVPPRRPVAADSLVPPLLANPPWTRPKAARIPIAVPEVAPSIHWLPGEREEWSWDYWPPQPDEEWVEARRDGWRNLRFMIGAPEALVRPLLADWAIEKEHFHLENPRLLVAKYELDALAPVLRLARRKPAVGAGLLLPYLAVEVAHVMARWLSGSRRFRPVAEQLFERHGAQGVALVLPTALGGPPRDSRPVALALARLDPTLVRQAGEQLGCAAEVEALLAIDPLDLVPSSVPKVPSWVDLDALPQVLLRDRAHALPRPAVEALCRMAAMSQLDQPYEGLRVVREALDPDSLAAFAWALFAEWYLAERPSKDAWMFDALAWFGDGSVADRLAPMIQRWPSLGAAARAKRGADVLAAMDDDAALQQLGVIARRAKSGPLRAHAAQALDRAAFDRGLLPEQLDDLLAPDLGLGESLEHRGVEHTVELGAGLDLVLRTAEGESGTLPRPRDDDEKAAVAAWNKRRRQGKAAVADQGRRLEEAMVVQRSWTGPEFATAICAHPLLGRLARRLVWRAGDRTAVVDALGDLVEVDGALVTEASEVRLAHPATSDLTAWRQWFADRGIPQPFPQVDREVFDEDPSAHWNRTVSAASLYALLRRGWQWGPTGHAALRGRIVRPLGPAGTVVLAFGPGLSAVHDAAGEPDQLLEWLHLESPRHGDMAVFGDLPRVTRSELVRDLRLLT